jgi:hypothetical protein
MSVVVVMERDRKLPQLILALSAAGRFPRCLNRRQEQGDKNADDGDNDEQLDECKTV